MKDNSKITEYSSSLYAESLLEFRQSLQATPRSAPTLCTTAGVYNNLGFPDLAKLFYKLAIEADPKDANAHFRYGFFLHHVQGKLEEASESYSVSLSLEKDANNMRSYAGLLVKMKVGFTPNLGFLLSGRKSRKLRMFLRKRLTYFRNRCAATTTTHSFCSPKVNSWALTNIF